MPTETQLKRAVNGIVAPYLRDDVLQEVRIRLWQLEQERPGEDLSGLDMMVARRTARRVSMRAIQGQNPWTGSPSLVGKQRGERTIIHGDMEMNEGQTVWDHHDFATEEKGYDDSEIRTIVDSLGEEDAKLVYMRFWDHATNKEIALELGTTEAAIEKRWAKRIRPKLRSHLEDSV